MPIASHQSRSSLLPLFVLACAVTLLRVAYLLWWCPYDLVEDEAQYWLWSKHLSLSYYSKGPGIAWAIWCATRIYGDAEWAVRMVPAVSGGIATFAVGGLVRDTARRTGWLKPTSLALFAAAIFALAPVQQASSILATIDGPLLAAWALAAWAGWRALHERSWAAWLALGVAVGAGFLFKYTMALIVPGLLLHAWMCRGRLQTSRGAGAGAAIAGALALASCIPVLLWNSQNDWVTVRHLLGHLGVRGGDMAPAAGGDGREPYEWLPVWPLGLVLMQIGMWGPVWLVGLVRALPCSQWDRRPPCPPDAPGASDTDSHAPHEVGRLYLAHLAAPIGLFYLVVAYVNKPEGNWPLAAGVTLVPLGAVELVRLLHRWRGGAAGSHSLRRRVRAASIALCLLYGILAIPFVHRADATARWTNYVLRSGPAVKLVSAVRRKPIAQIRPGRLIGARIMGDEAGRIMAELRLTTGREPFLLAQHYGRASQMAYYAPWPTGPGGEPARDVFSSGALTWGRLSHFDFMPEHSLARPDLAGRPALILSNDDPGIRAVWERLFDHVVEYDGSNGLPRLPGEHKRDRVAYLGYGFKGLSEPIQ